MAYTVYIPQEIVGEGVDFLLQRGYEVNMGGSIDRENIIKNMKNSDAVLLRTVVLDSEILNQSADRLKVISKHGVGVDNIDLDAARQKGIRVTNAPLSNSNSVAEHAIALVMALSKHLVECDHIFKRNGDFDLRYRYKNTDVLGKTLGIVGMGRIGSLLVKKAAMGLGMNVLAYDPYIKEPPQHEVQVLNNLKDLFSNSDFISLHLPLLQSTRHLVNYELLSVMKPSAYFINVARGELVVERDLIRALNEGIIAGAGLDVFEVEPTTSDLELLKMENVILSPHNAALTEGSLIRMAVDAAKGIHEVLSGKEPTWPVI